MSFQPYLSRDSALLIQRLSFGGCMAAAHGFAKLANFSEYSASFPDPIGLGSTVSLALAVFAEFFCAIAVALGLKFRMVLLPLIITMIVAAFVVHGDDPFAKKELAILYLASFLSMFFSGPGKYAIDRD